jgi:hypothetical protein
MSALRATNATLASLIQSAYGIREDRLIGGPNWVRTARFDVNGKAEQALPREQLRVMAQRLLETRFGVVLTREQRTQDVYALRLARPDRRLGPDVRRAADDCLGEAAGGVPINQPARPRMNRPQEAIPRSPDGARRSRMWRRVCHDPLASKSSIRRAFRDGGITCSPTLRSRPTCLPPSRRSGPTYRRFLPRSKSSLDSHRAQPTRIGRVRDRRRGARADGDVMKRLAVLGW